MGVAYAKCGDAFYTWDLYTGVRYMQSGTLCNGKIAYMENIVVVADRTQLLSGTAHPMLYAPNELPKLPDGNGDGSAGGEQAVDCGSCCSHHHRYYCCAWRLFARGCRGSSLVCAGVLCCLVSKRIQLTTESRA